METKQKHRRLRVFLYVIFAVLVIPTFRAEEPARLALLVLMLVIFLLIIYIEALPKLGKWKALLPAAALAVYYLIQLYAKYH